MSLPKNAVQPLPLHKLSAEEASDPVLVLDDFFDFAHLPQVRTMLWNWLKCTVTGSYPESLTNEERAEILLLYEKLEKLVEASYVIHQKNKS